MVDIGKVAGKVWEELNRNDKMTINSLIKATGEKRDVILMAIGWLSREDKLNAIVKGAYTLYSLK